MAKLSLRNLDAAGWPFWFLVFAVLLAPCIMASKALLYRTAPWYGVGGTGLMLDAFAASFIAWGVNAALQRRDRQRRKTERKKAKKRK